MRFRGRPIFEIPVPLSGLAYDDSYAWRAAAHWARYSWQDFCALSSDEQSAIVAHYMTQARIEAVIAKDMEEKRRRAERKRRR